MKIPQIILRKNHLCNGRKEKTYSTSESKSVDGSITIELEITNNATKILETYPNQGQLEANKMELNGETLFYLILKQLKLSLAKPPKVKSFFQ